MLHDLRLALRTHLRRPMFALLIVIHRRRSRTFADLAAMPAVNSTLNLTGEGEPQVITRRSVTGNFFEVLGVRQALRQE